MEPNQICPHCKASISQESYFCPNCGKKLKEKPLSTSLGSQMGIYLLSIFLPPLGLWPGFKYLSQKDQKAQVIGIVAIVLTLVSTVITTWFTLRFVNDINQKVNEQLNSYQNLGF